MGQLRLVCFGIAVVWACSPPSSGVVLRTDQQAASRSGHVADACPDRRVIGRRLGASCPAAAPSPSGAWVLSSPFRSVYAAPVLPARLDVFCRYDWSAGPSGAPPNMATLPAESGRAALDWLDRDCQVVAPLGAPEEIGETLGPSLRAAFLEQVEWSASLSVDPAVHERPVLVSIIDASTSDPTEADGSATGGRIDHGYQVSQIVREIACRDQNDSDPSDGCLAISDHPCALPRINADEVDLEQCGYFGSHGDLAAAIYDALERVDEMQTTAPVQHQILNLSVGWLPEYGGDRSSRHVSGPVQAVFAALEEARCRGALIIAAAGNDQGGTGDRTGLLYPAAWQNQGANCDGVTRRPLLYAAGGVDGIDHAFANGRVHGRPRFAAPAAQAVVANRFGAPGHTKALSGTSVAAAVLSAASAIVWSYRPPLNADQVAELVYAQAIDLAEPADDCVGANCSIRRISICRAIQAACAGGGSPCPANVSRCFPSPAGRDARPDRIYSGVDLVATIDTTFMSTAYAWNGAPIASSCPGPALGLPAPPFPCPFEERSGALAAPWVDPQPETPVCPHCFVSRNVLDLTFYASVSTDFKFALSDVVLALTTSQGTTTFVSLPPQNNWVAGAVFKVTGIPLPAGQLISAKLTYMINDGGDKPRAESESILLY